MPGISRLTDIGVGVCPCHDDPEQYTTMFVTGAPTVKTNGRDTAFIGTVGISSCGHPTTALTGSASLIPGGSPAVRIGDTGANCGTYTTVTGSDNTFNDR